MTGDGRNRDVTRELAIPAYARVRYLGRSGHEIGKVLGVSLQSIYAASSHIQGVDVITSKDVERWCR